MSSRFYIVNPSLITPLPSSLLSLPTCRFVELLRDCDALKAEKILADQAQREKDEQHEKELKMLNETLAVYEKERKANLEKINGLQKNVETLTTANKELRGKVEELSIACDEGVISLQMVTEERDKVKAEHALLHERHQKLVAFFRQKMPNIQPLQPQPQVEAVAPAPAPAPVAATTGGRVAITTGPGTAMQRRPVGTVGASASGAGAAAMTAGRPSIGLGSLTFDVGENHSSSSSSSSYGRGPAGATINTSNNRRY
jgi:hypothetical protein